MSTGGGGGSGGGGGGGTKIGELYVDLSVRDANLDKELEDARRAAERTARQLDQLEAQYRAGSVSAGAYANRLQMLRDLHQDATIRVKNLETAVSRQSAQMATAATATVQFDTSMAQVGGRRNMGMAVLEASRALEDLQYGLAGVINNIPSLVSALGFGMGVAGVVSVAAVGVFQLYKHWDDLQGLLGSGIPQPALQGPELLAENLAKANAELEELQKKGRLSLPEFFRMGELKEQVEEMKRQREEMASLDEILGTRTKGQQERGAGFKEAVAEAGGDRAFGALKEALAKDADAAGKVLDPLSGKIKTVEEVARGLFVAAAEGDKSARDIVRQRVAGTFGADNTFARAIDESSPEAKAEAKRKEDEQKKRDDRKEQEKKERDRRAEEADKRAAELEKPMAARLESQIMQARQMGFSEQDIMKAERDQVVEELTRAGVDPAEADELAGPIADKAIEAATKAERDKALTLGTDRAGARAAILAEQEEASRRRDEAEATRIASAAREAIPGLDELARDTFLRARTSGGTDAEAARIVAEQARARLREQGFSDEEAALGAGEIAGSASDKVRQEIVKRLLGGEEGQKLRAVETSDVGSFTSRIQSAGQDTDRRSLKVQEEMLQTLIKIERRGPGDARPRLS